MLPKISVIIPIYNCEEYLIECLHSLETQTLKDIQVILVDDGSTDDSASICKEFVKNNSNFEYYYKENGGSASARNLGLSKASGEYIGFIDSDDWIEPDMYRQMYNAAKNNNDTDIVFCRVFEDETPGAYDYIFPRPGYFNRDEMRNEIFPYLLPCLTDSGTFRSLRWCNWLRIYKHSVLENNNISFYDKSRRCEDLGFSFEATIQSNSYYYLDKSFYHNRPNAHSKSRTYSKNMWYSINNLMNYLYKKSEECLDFDFSKNMDYCVFYFCIMVLRNEFHLKDKKLRLEKMREVIKSDLCRKAIAAISSQGMNRKYENLYEILREGNENDSDRFFRKEQQKLKLTPLISKVARNKVIRKLFRK